MKKLKIYSEFNKKTLKNNLKLYKNCSISDKRVFNFVEMYINNDLNVTKNNDEITVIDENMISKNELEIATKLLKSKQNILYKQLDEKFLTFRKLANEYEILLSKHDKNLKLSQKDHKKLDLLLLKMTYTLIELKINLNLDLYDISINNINSYCNCIIFDILNKDYESLSIDKHIYNRTLNFKKKHKIQI